MSRPNAARPLRLITIGFSHFCEKARWALDRTDVVYREEDHVPLLHWRATRGVGGGRTVPVLVTPEAVLRESSDIIKYCDALVDAERRLYPEDAALRAEVESLVAEFDRGLGPATRRFLYYHLMSRRGATADLLASTGPRWERAVIRGACPAVVAVIRRGLKIDLKGAERSRDRILATLDAVDLRLADGRRYLVGDRFTAADLTFASLGAVVAAPPGYGFPIPESVMHIPELAAFREMVRARPAGQLLMRLYEERPAVRGLA